MGNAGQKSRSLIWIVVLIVVVAAWFFFLRTENNVARSVIEADRAAQLDADPDDILVDFGDDVSAERVAEIASDLGIEFALVSVHSEDERFYRAHVAADRRDAVLAELSKMSEVEIAEPDAMAFASPGVPVLFGGGGEPNWEGYPNDPQYKHQWHLDQIKMPAAWKLADGEGVTVAVLDTGVAYGNHQQFHLVDDLNGVEFTKPYNFVNNNKHAYDDHGHGTHVAGTIAQATNNDIGVAGVARAVKIMPVKVLSASGSGSVGGIADAIRYAADEGAQVINMSLGSRFPSRVLEKAVNYAHKKGTTVVCASGNDGRGKVGYPAAYDKALAVGATQFDESVTFYSNYGKALDVTAPGGNTQVDQNNDGMPDGVLQNTITIGDPTKSDYYGFMGTSMASPHAAGVAALIVGEGITNPDAVEKILEDTARKPKNQKMDANKYGAGIIDAEAAVLAARSKTGAGQLFFALLLGAALAFGTRKNDLFTKSALGGASPVLNGKFALGALFGAGGLFFLPYLAPGFSSLPVIETFTRGIPSWDLGILGVTGHGSPLFFSALIPLGLVGLFLGVKGARPVLAGLLIGVAGHLVYHAVNPIADIRFVPAALEMVWLGANAALCVGMAKLVMRR